MTCSNCAKKSPTLRELADDATTLVDLLSETRDRRRIRPAVLRLANTVCQVADPALSPDTEGWVSPEVAKQAAEVIRARTIALHMNNGHSNQPDIENCAVSLCRESCAALDALKET